jgi:putative phosphoribosyl transferase
VIDMRFQDRADAGRRLAEKLVGRVPLPTVVAGIPRGGLVVARPVAEALQAPLSVVHARKLTVPSWPELAFGAMDEEGYCLIDRESVESMGLTSEQVEGARIRVGAEIERRIALYGAASLRDWLPGRSVVLVDDGLATGLTMRAGLEMVRRHGAEHVVVAVPCAPPRIAREMSSCSERFVGLIVDPAFRSVGAYYDTFDQVSDDEVRAILAPSRARPLSPRAVVEADRGVRPG